MHEISSDNGRSRGRLVRDIYAKQQIEPDQVQNMQQLKQENQKLKKLLKEAQAKRTQITKECSQLSKKVQQLQQQNRELKGIVREEENKFEGEKYRWEELKFLNSQLASEIEELRKQNEGLTHKLRYSSEVLQQKYEQLQAKTYKKMQQSAKRIKKAIHYLQSLSVKNLDKTREDLIQNLRKSIELLRGKYFQQLNCEGEIQQLMNPLRTLQQQIIQKTKEASHYKQQNIRLHQQSQKYKQMQKQQIPMFKQAIDKLKKNLAQARKQLSENQYQKLQLKKKYEEKIKEIQWKYNEVFKQCRKIKLEKKIYQNKLVELEADVEQEKERLIGENILLKKLYQNNSPGQESSTSRVSHSSSHYKISTLADKKTQQKRLVKNYSSNQLKTSHMGMAKLSNCDEQQPSVEISEYNQQSSLVSQDNLKQQICRIDQQIIQIQRNLNRELQGYR